jgi:hypothetical protein
MSNNNIETNEVSDKSKTSESVEVKMSIRKQKKFKRVPFRKQERIGVAKKPGIYTRLVNDVGNRIARFKKAGFTLRENSEIRNGGKDAADASQFGNVACQNVDREGRMGYYMDIPEEMIREDIEYKEQETIDLLNEIGIKNEISNREGKIKITLSGNTEIDDKFNNKSK